MEWDYRLFVSVIEAGSIAAGGRRHGLSPAMASKRIARLESRLGARLIQRTTRRLSLTEAGAKFYVDVVDILGAVSRAEAAVTSVGGAPTGPLRISAPTSFGRVHVAPHLRNFIELYPRVHLSIDLSDSFADLVSEKIDLAIRISSSIPPGLTARRLASSRRVLCCAPSYLDSFGTPDSLEDLPRHRLLAASGQFPWRLTGPRGACEVDGKSHVQTNSSELVRELAISGVGIALRSLWDVFGHLQSGRLVRILPDFGGPADVGIYAVYASSGFTSPNVTAMIEYLATLYATAHDWD